MEHPSHEQLMLYAWNANRQQWVFIGSYSMELSIERAIAKQTNQHGFTRFHVHKMSPVVGQGVTWS